MKRALLAIGGDGPDRAAMSLRAGHFDILAAADSGIDLLSSWGWKAELAVGDFDSVMNTSLLDDCPTVIRHSRDKDESDTELAIKELYKRGYPEITLAGGAGGRMDHLLAIWALFEKDERPLAWLCPGEALYYIERPTRFVCRDSGRVSVFPLKNGARGMKSQGLLWPLDGLVWEAGDCGLSNIAPDGSFEITPGDEPLIVVLDIMDAGPITRSKG